MPKVAKELSAKAVSHLEAEGRYAVGGAAGLHLYIAGKGRSWVLRVIVGGRRRDFGLGSYPDIGLSAARDKARDLRRQLQNPSASVAQLVQAPSPISSPAATIAPRKQQSFRVSAQAYIRAHSAGWKNAKHSTQWGSSLEAYAYPLIGALDVAEVDTARVLEVLQQMVGPKDDRGTLWNKRTETASRLRGRIENVLDWARVAGFRSGENPARWRGHLDKLLPARSKVQKVKPHAALPYDDLPAFMAELRGRGGMSHRALEFAILTAARSGEVRLATWSEVDLDKAIWTVAADRMKAGKEHRIPLASEAVALLQGLDRIEGTDLIFPSPVGDAALSDMTLTAVIRNMGKTVTQHGFRSTFRDWAAEVATYPREVIEHALAHQLKDKAEAAYQRGDLLVKRRALMAEWAGFCAGKAAPPNSDDEGEGDAED